MKKYDEENSFHRKYTKTLMIISAIFLVVNGFVLSFFPNEISVLLTNDDNHIFINSTDFRGSIFGF
tara:strand:+ start:99 stop:296 length:198 start_codon:yes stop_codon:yes gene_type:complete